MGKLDEAVGEFRAAIRLQPGLAEAHCNLGGLLKRRGDYAEALEMYRKGHELGSQRPGWRYPSAQWVAEAEHLVAQSNRLPAILRGDDKPRDNSERLSFAQMAYDRKQYAAAVRLWSDALAIDPKLADRRQDPPRYNAACAAAMAAAGMDKGDPSPDDAAKTRHRAQALDSLKAELSVWTKLLESGPPETRSVILQSLQHWKQDTDLAGVRDVEALAKLPEDERKEWRALWAKVDAVLNHAARSAVTSVVPAMMQFP